MLIALNTKTLRAIIVPALFFQQNYKKMLNPLTIKLLRTAEHTKILLQYLATDNRRNHQQFNQK